MTPPEAALVIVGAGGHGREVLDVVEAVNRVEARWRFVGFLSDAAVDEALFDRRGVAVLGPAELAIDSGWWVSLAIGEPLARRLVRDRLGATMRAATLVHPEATVARDAELGAGVMVPAGARVGAGVVLGPHTHLNVNASVEVQASVGEFATVSPGVVVGKSAQIGPEVFIGIGAVIAEGVSVGAGARIGAGASVVSDVAAGATVVGVPARSVSPQRT